MPAMTNHKKTRQAWRFLSLILALGPISAAGLSAHPGDLDEFGGHFDARSTEYHYHRPKPEMAQRKKEHLSWIELGRIGELRGKVVEIDRPDALWVRIDYRPAYQDFARLLSPSSRRDDSQAVLVWFQHVSPEASVSGGKKYRVWFNKKVVYELDQKLKDQPVVVQFRVLPSAPRLYGQVTMGKENINLWLILNGWSFYLLPREGQEPNKAEKSFKEAEQIARKQKLGLWKKSG